MALHAPGFFGKVPARGDFVGRHVAPGLMEIWDPWLGMLTTAVREAAGTDWPEVWLTAPVWHFALGAALVPAPGAAGVLVASADRVGRLFPFTLIGPATGIPDEAWCDAVEELVLTALEDGFDAEVLEDALTALGAPATGADLPPGQSLWRCRGSDRVEPTSRLMFGLPKHMDAVSMVLGGGEAEPPALEMGLE